MLGKIKQKGVFVKDEDIRKLWKKIANRWKKMKNIEKGIVEKELGRQIKKEGLEFWWKEI